MSEIEEASPILFYCAATDNQNKNVDNTLIYLELWIKWLGNKSFWILFV